jgi:hypothetical protein
MNMGVKGWRTRASGQNRMGICHKEGKDQTQRAIMLMKKVMKKKKKIPS